MKAIAAFGILSALMLLQTASAFADQCPPGSGKYCPAGTHCAYGDCVYDNPWKPAASIRDDGTEVTTTCALRPTVPECRG